MKVCMYPETSVNTDTLRKKEKVNENHPFLSSNKQETRND